MHTLTIRSIPLCTGFLVALKDRASTTSIGTDPQATRQIGDFTWASVHALSALRRILPPADELLVTDELFRTSKSKIVVDELFRTSKIDFFRGSKLINRSLSSQCHGAGHPWESWGVVGPKTRLGGGRGRFEGTRRFGVFEGSQSTFT